MQKRTHGLKSRKEFCLARGYKTILIFLARDTFCVCIFVLLAAAAAAEYLCEPIMQCQREWMRSTLNELTCVILFNLF